MSSASAVVVPLLPRRARQERARSRTEALLHSLPRRDWEPILVPRPEWPGPGVGDPNLAALPRPA